MKKILMILLVVSFSRGYCYSQARDSFGVHVTYFLSTTCKICQFYSIEMRDIYKEYSARGIEFEGLFPGKLENDSTLQSFKELYQIPFTLKTDDDKHVEWNATITPEVFVTNSAGDILYYGRIDDAYFSVGKRRARIKHHELRDVLDALMKEEALSTQHVPAVGCIIEK